MENKNETPENFSAADAAILSLNKFPTMESLLQSIYVNAKNGQRCIRFFDMVMPFDIMQDLLKKGFILSKATGMIGEDIIVISWS